jgi:hypothetical protein
MAQREIKFRCNWDDNATHFVTTLWFFGSCETPIENNSLSDKFLHIKDI